MANTDIPLSQTVQVEITTAPTGAASANFGVLLLVTQEAPAAGVTLPEGIVYFSSLAEVAVRYPESTAPKTYAAANTYFAQEPTPLTLGIGRRYTAAQSGSLQGGGASEHDVADWVSIGADGSFSVSIDGSAVTAITGCDFTAVTTLAQVASVIQAKIRLVASGGFTLATCTYNSDTGCFTITSGTTGVLSSVSYLTDSGADPIGDRLKMKQGQAIKTTGIAIETLVTSCLDRLDAKDGGWYALAFTRETRDNDDVTDAATWCEAKVKQFFTVSNNEATKTLAYDTLTPTYDTASELHTAAHKRTFCVFSSYPDQYPEISAFARAATVNFEFKDSVITLKFKQLPGITTEVLNTSQLNNLTSKGCNVYMRTAGVNMLSDAMMAAGEGYYQDTTHNTDWLQDDIQKGVFNALYTSTTKIPETDDGVARLIEKVIKSLERGVNNGMIARNSYDTDDVFYAKGYTVTAQSVASLPAATRARRIAPPISFKAIGAGAIHKVVINGVFVA
jgi:hypothetical protein